MTRLAAAVLLTAAAVALTLGREGSRLARRGWAASPPASTGSRWGKLRQAALGGAQLASRLGARVGPARAPADLPLALDLLACALRAGQPPSTAAAVVANAVGGPVGEALTAVARAAELGAPADIAWQPLAALTSVAAVARTAARTAESGSRLADELVRIAADLRAGQAAAADARVRRAGVLVVLPLGLCFLPAFVLIGVVPIVIGVAGSVLR